MVVNQRNRIARHLQAAEGFLELDLPKLALEELGEISDPGDFQIPVLWMTAEALKTDGRFEEAVAPLQHIAKTVPSPMNEEACKSLSECLEKSGRGSLPTPQQNVRKIALKLAPNQTVKIKFG